MIFKTILDKLWQNVIIKQLAYLMFIIIFLSLSLLLFLNIYTQHGKSQTVPDFSNMTLEEVQNEMHRIKLRYAVIDSVYSNAHPKGTVVDQDPKPDVKVKKNRRIYLTMNAVNPEKMVMPNLVELSLRRAKNLIISSGLVLGQIQYKPHIAVQEVIAQKIRGREVNAGDTIIKGSIVDLEVGNGLSSELTIVPYLIGMHLKQAKNTLNKYSLHVGGNMYDENLTLKEKKTAKIYKQSPVHNINVRIPLGSSVDVWLSNDTVNFSGLTVDSLKNNELDDTY